VQWLLDQRPDLLNRPVNPKRSTMLHLAVASGRTAIVEELLRRKADVNARNAFGATPLHECTEPGLAALLLEHGADVTLKTRDGLNALQLAVNRHRADVAQVLREHGAKE
jgi:ankyrin repeat protein